MTRSFEPEATESLNKNRQPTYYDGVADTIAVFKKLMPNVKLHFNQKKKTIEVAFTPKTYGS